MNHRNPICIYPITSSVKTLGLPKELTFENDLQIDKCVVEVFDFEH